MFLWVHEKSINVPFTSPFLEVMSPLCPPTKTSMSLSCPPIFLLFHWFFGRNLAMFLQLHQNKPLGIQGVYRLSLLWFMYDFIQLKKDMFSKSSSGIGPAYARYYDSHTCHPTHFHYNRKRLHFQELLENNKTLILRFSVAWLFLLVVSQL